MRQIKLISYEEDKLALSTGNCN